MSVEDVVVIGAGIVGGCVARELSKYENLSVKLVEKELDVSCGTTKANTGIIHAGYDDDPLQYPVRARLCSKGNKLWHEMVEELNIHVNWCGSIVGTTDDEEIAALELLLKRGIANNVPDLKLLVGEEARRLEPKLNNLKAALYAPTEGTVLPFEAAIAIVENAKSNGVLPILDAKVVGIEQSNGCGFIVKTSAGDFKADWVINAAGLYGDEVSKMVGIFETNNGVDIKIRPRRGEYWIFPSEYGSPVKHIVFSVPSGATKGIVLTPDPEGSLIVGPNSEELSSMDKEEKATTRAGLNEVYKFVVGKWGPILPPRNRCIKNFAGLRAEPQHGDFIVEGYKKCEGFINAIGIRSPGLTSAPMIAKEVLNIMVEQGFKGKVKDKWNPYRAPIPRALSLPYEQRRRLVSEDSRYSHLVCWCEGVSEGEIVEAIKRGARTIQGVSFRTRAGLGRCQGMSCQSKIVEILSRELGVPPEKVLLKSKGSEVLACRIKDLVGVPDESN